MRSQYDLIGEQYLLAEENPIRRGVIVPTAIEMLGDVRNLDVLDFGCGYGGITTLIKEAGARRVVGIDNSQKMIELAKKIEERAKRGIEYFLADAREMPKLGEFDIANATFLLCYSNNHEEMLNICKGMYRNLKAGGRLVTLTDLFEDESVFGRWICGSNRFYSAKLPLSEGDRVTITIRGKNAEASFDVGHWSRKTQHNAVLGAGFKDIRWRKATPSEEGMKEFGREFWEDYFKYPNVWGIEAVK